jgi:hypothetical protein
MTKEFLERTTLINESLKFEKKEKR